MSGGMSLNGYPNNIQVEAVEGCNRMCPFCGIYGIWKHKQDRKIHFMQVGLAWRIAESLKKWGFNRKRVEFAMHGEPTLHSELPTILQYFRKRLPECQLQVTTNGSILAIKGPTYVKQLFASGINLLLVDMYNDQERIRKVCVNSGFPIKQYYKGDINPYHYNGHTLKCIVDMGDLKVKTGERRPRTIFNHAGNCNPTVVTNAVPLPLRKMCTRPFRELVIHYDGSVPICCVDWRHEHIIGVFPRDGTLQHLWESMEFQSVRTLLLRRNRSFLPCYRCDNHGGFRVGLVEHPSTQISETAALNYVNTHLEKTKQYRHHNSVPPNLYQRDTHGIQQFI